MEEMLFQKDSYLKEFEGTVTARDMGALIRSDKEPGVAKTKRKDGGIHVALEDKEGSLSL